MSTLTAIEWADYTWNLVWGCTKVSPGCDHCYIDRTPPFRMAGMKFDKPGTGGSIPLVFHDSRMYDPLRKRKPGKWFVNSLSDMFHKDIPDEFIAKAFAVMRLADHHIFQLLTKRHGRMFSLLSSDEFHLMVDDATNAIVADPAAPLSKLDRDTHARRPVPYQWPIPNVHGGVTVEDQKRAELRIPELLMTPFAVRFLSMEPLLGPVDLTRIPWPRPRNRRPAEMMLDVVHGVHGMPKLWGAPAKRIDWVIVGGESGPKARPMHPDWARSLRDQCETAGVPFLFKQAGHVLAKEWGATGKGTDPAEWPESFPREYPA